MDCENRETSIFVIGTDNNFNETIENLNITDIFDVRDRTRKRLILSRLATNEKKLLIESKFLKVVGIDNIKNKIIIELDNETENIFRQIDNKVIDLLGGLLDEDNTKMENVELNLENELTYVPLVSDDEKTKNTFRLCLDSKTVLKYKKNTINLQQIKIGDMFRFLIELESINLYPNELLCHIRLYCHIGEIYRTNTVNLNSRKHINDYTFSTDVENVFNKIVLEDQDINLIKTEKEPECLPDILPNITEINDFSTTSSLKQEETNDISNQLPLQNVISDKQEFDNQELDNQELDRQELDRQELDNQEIVKQELDRQEIDRQEIVKQEVNIVPEIQVKIKRKYVRKTPEEKQQNKKSTTRKK
jgi:hypothetical protein